MAYEPPIKTVDVQVTVQMVECRVCGKRHDPDGDTYLTVHGNICIGKSGGIVGNNLDRETGRVNNVTAVCMSRRCILQGLFYSRPEFDFLYNADEEDLGHPRPENPKYRTRPVPEGLFE